MRRALFEPMLVSAVFMAYDTGCATGVSVSGRFAMLGINRHAEEIETVDELSGQETIEVIRRY